MLPLPNNGDVVLFSYLWEQEHKRLQEEGLKDRPCVVVASFENKEGKPSIIVAPITHTPPKDIDNAIEVPQATKDRLGLDDEGSWIITSEVNITNNISRGDGLAPTLERRYGLNPAAGSYR